MSSIFISIINKLFRQDQQPGGPVLPLVDANQVEGFDEAAREQADIRIAELRGEANGLAPLVNGMVPAAYLAGAFDEVKFFDSLSDFPNPGANNTLYATRDTNLQYRWSGTAYVPMTASPGTTDAVPEGTLNRYYTDARAIGAKLAGYAKALAIRAIAPTDTVSVAVGLLELKADDNSTRLGTLETLANGDQIKRIQYPAYTLVGTTATVYASLQVGLTTIGGTAASSVYARPIHLTGAADVHRLTTTFTRRIGTLIGDAVEPAIVDLTAGVRFSLAIDLTRVSFSGAGVLVLLFSSTVSGLTSGEAQRVEFNATLPGQLELRDYNIREWSNPSGVACTVELYGTSSVPEAPYPAGITVVDKTNVRHDQLAAGGNGNSLLAADGFIDSKYFRPTAFKGFETGPIVAVDGVLTQTYLPVPAEMVAALQPALDEAIDSRIEASGGNPGGGGSPGGDGGAGLGAMFAQDNYTEAAGVMSGTDPGVLFRAVSALVAGTESRLIMTVGSTGETGKLELTAGKTLPDGSGNYGKQYAIWKSYNHAGLIVNGTRVEPVVDYDTPNGVDVELCLHRWQNGGVDTLSFEGSTDGGTTWTIIHSVPYDGTARYAKFSGDAGQSIEKARQTGYTA
jgi:hypothetical protein